MKKLSLSEVAGAVGGNVVNDSDNVFINGVTMDSRKVVAGNLFVAIKGERVDGHDFIADVFSKGASAVICDHVPDGVIGPCVVVDNTVKALQDLAEYYRTSLGIKVVGITGSVGKTSTKEIISAVLSVKYNVLKTAGNYNNEIGLPLTVLSIEEDHDLAVLEMGISDFGEMRVLTKIARPDVCVITNIGQSHLEALGSRDGIYRAKAEIFEYMNPQGYIFLNGDDDILCTKKDINGIKPVFFGLSSGNDVYPERMNALGLKGTELSVNLEGDRFDVTTGLFGKHMIGNAMAAAAVGRALSMTDEEIARGIAEASTIAGRLNLIPFGEGFIIDDCYNAAPASMKAGVDTLSLAKGRKVAVLGDMFELGPDSDSMHYEVGEYAAKAAVDEIICIGENAKHLYDGAKAAGSSVALYHFDSIDDFKKEAASLIHKGDNVLVKASHGMEFIKVVDLLKEM